MTSLMNPLPTSGKWGHDSIFSKPCTVLRLRNSRWDIHTIIPWNLLIHSQTSYPLSHCRPPPLPATTILWEERTIKRQLHFGENRERLDPGQRHPTQMKVSKWEKVYRGVNLELSLKELTGNSQMKKGWEWRVPSTPSKYIYGENTGK